MEPRRGWRNIWVGRRYVFPVTKNLFQVTMSAGCMLLVQPGA